ncbi:hypothetical protein Trydic_g19187 [Trypoxylus dichotomus]
MKDIRLGGTLIECKLEVKYLGINLDKKLLWNRHITLTTNKATRALIICRNLAGHLRPHNPTHSGGRGGPCGNPQTNQRDPVPETLMIISSETLPISKSAER